MSVQLVKAHEWVKALPSGPVVLCLGAIAHGKAEVFVFWVGGLVGVSVGGRWVYFCCCVCERESERECVCVLCVFAVFYTQVQKQLG